MTWNFLKHVGMSESLLFEDHEQQKFASDGQDMQGIYSDPVRTAPQIEFNSYHPVTSRFQHDTWEPGKFMIAFSGVLSSTSPLVIRVIYSNYYRMFCEYQNVTDECVEIQPDPLPGVPQDPMPAFALDGFGHQLPMSA